MTEPWRLQTIIDALGLPADARVNTRVPKKMLVEQGAPTAADKRAIQDGIDEISWIGALKPNTVGIRAFSDETREYLEIAVLMVSFRAGAKSARLVELIHRAIPYPLLLIAETAEGFTLSIAHKRYAQNEAGKIVIETSISTRPMGKPEPGDIELAFLAGIAVARQSPTHLFALYEGWRARIEALSAAGLTGAFAASDEPQAIALRRAALASHERLTREAAVLRARAAKEKQMNKRVELNVEIRRLEAAAQEALKEM